MNLPWSQPDPIGNMDRPLGNHCCLENLKDPWSHWLYALDVNRNSAPAWPDLFNSKVQPYNDLKIMKRMEESMQQPHNAPENATQPGTAQNKKRTPTNPRHDLYNSNALLKQIMKDCIDEGM